MNNNFLIEESDIEHAQNICSEVEEISIRNRAVANTLAAKIATRYFTDDEVDTDSGLHNIKHVMNDLDISDIYIKDSYIDVRLYFEDHKVSLAFQKPFFAYFCEMQHTLHPQKNRQGTLYHSILANVCRYSNCAFSFHSFFTSGFYHKF